MAYEVEKRSKLTAVKYDQLQKYLDLNAKFKEEKRLDSYLFRKPSYLRIRLISGNPIVYITEKTGTYHDTARYEKEQSFERAKLSKFISEKYAERYKLCVPIITYRRTYIIDDLKVELNKISYLGRIVEVEAITDNKSNIPRLGKKVDSMLKQLDVLELSADTYQKMLDKAYNNHIVDIKTISFDKML